jgi:hypothetical protein
VQDNSLDANPLPSSFGEDFAAEPAPESETSSQPVVPEASRVRAARAKLIEEISYRLTDLITIISVRIELLSDKAPGNCWHDLLAIRAAALKGVEFSKRLHQAARDCRSEIGL